MISAKIIIFSLNTNRGERLSEQAMIGKRRRRLDTVADEFKNPQLNYHCLLAVMVFQQFQ